jgi:undecaprenyl-diphosphatase
VGIGLAPSVAALFRGISRSGSTVTAALWVGLDPTAAAEFSFLLSIPIIAGAALVEGRHATVDIAAVGGGPLALSFLVAFVAGIFSIRFLVVMLKRGRFYLFGPYCWGAGLFVIAYGLWHP